MKDWQEIIKLYERDNVYIAEAAQIFVRNVQYEIPGIKKYMMRCDQQGQDSEKKIHELVKSENTVNSEYNLLCSQLGIKGVNIKAELLAKLNELHMLLNDAANFRNPWKCIVNL